MDFFRYKIMQTHLESNFMISPIQGSNFWKFWAPRFGKNWKSLKVQTDFEHFQDFNFFGIFSRPRVSAPQPRTLARCPDCTPSGALGTLTTMVGAATSSDFVWFRRLFSYITPPERDTSEGPFKGTIGSQQVIFAYFSVFSPKPVKLIDLLGKSWISRQNQVF